MSVISTLVQQLMNDEATNSEESLNKSLDGDIATDAEKVAALREAAIQLDRAAWCYCSIERRFRERAKICYRKVVDIESRAGILCQDPLHRSGFRYQMDFEENDMYVRGLELVVIYDDERWSYKADCALFDAVTGQGVAELERVIRQI